MKSSATYKQVKPALVKAPRSGLGGLEDKVMGVTRLARPATKPVAAPKPVVKKSPVLKAARPPKGRTAYPDITGQMP